MRFCCVFVDGGVANVASVNGALETVLKICWIGKKNENVIFVTFTTKIS
jgi:hypothetical protein